MLRRSSTHVRLHRAPLSRCLVARELGCYRLGGGLMCPQTNLYALLARIVAKALEVGNIPIEGRCLTITSSVTIVRENPTQWHIVFLITVDNGTSRELIVLLFAIQTFLDTAIVLLTFLHIACRLRRGFPCLLRLSPSNSLGCRH